MKIKRDGFVFRTAYFWHQPYNQPWEQVNICKLFWFFVLSSLLFGLAVVIYIAVHFPLSVVTVLLFGYRVCPLWEKSYIRKEAGTEDSIFAAIKRWPKTEKGKQVMPGVYLLILLLLALLSTGSYWASKGVTLLVLFLWELSPAVFLTCLAIVAGSIIVATPKFRRSEAWQLLKTFAKAKKEKLCPYVEIVS